MQLEISDAEYDLLVEILEACYGDVRAEIHRTDNPAYKYRLKEQEGLLETILNRLRGLRPSAASA